jgi:hypothetical protein
MKTKWLLAVVLACSACPRLPAGESCSATGEGFTRQDPCSYTCVDWEIDCADGSTVTPGVCSGPACSAPGDCDAGYECARVGSVTYSCLPVGTCPTGGFAAAGGPGSGFASAGEPDPASPIDEPQSFE